MDNERMLREHVLAVLDGGHAHMSLEDAVEDFPEAHINTRPLNVPYTFWHLIEHLRITQWDILEYVRNPRHVSPRWPEGYWPPADAMADASMWQDSIRRFHDDLAALKALVADPAMSLLDPIPHGYDGHTLLREALLTADHNAYHIGELGILRQVMGLWSEKHA